MEFFKPWGRDFVVLRSLNKRTKAAYHDHLNNMINIDQFMARNSEAARVEAEKAISNLIQGFCTEPLTPPEPLMFMDDETEELVKALVLEPVQALSKRLESMSLQTKTSEGAENTYHIFTQSDMEPYL